MSTHVFVSLSGEAYNGPGRFKIGCHRPFAALLQHVPVPGTLYYAGRAIGPDDTPDALHMPPGEIVECTYVVATAAIAAAEAADAAPEPQAALAPEPQVAARAPSGGSAVSMDPPKSDEALERRGTLPPREFTAARSESPAVAIRSGLPRPVSDTEASDSETHRPAHPRRTASSAAEDPSSARPRPAVVRSGTEPSEPSRSVSPGYTEQRFRDDAPEELPVVINSPVRTESQQRAVRARGSASPKTDRRPRRAPPTPRDSRDDLTAPREGLPPMAPEATGTPLHPGGPARLTPHKTPGLRGAVSSHESSFAHHGVGSLGSLGHVASMPPRAPQYPTAAVPGAPMPAPMPAGPSPEVAELREMVARLSSEVGSLSTQLSVERAQREALSSRVAQLEGSVRTVAQASRVDSAADAEHKRLMELLRSERRGGSHPRAR